MRAARDAQRRWFIELYGIAHDARLLTGLRDDLTG
jgi:hypothetical protein